MGARNQNLAKEGHIWSLRFIIAIQFVLIIVFYNRSIEASKINRVYMPENIAAGTYINLNVPNDAVLYQFGLYILKATYRWYEDGLEEYNDNLYKYQAFITPQCRKEMKKDYTSRMKELPNRSREQEEVPGRGYDAKRVEMVNGGRWRIWYDLRIKERIGDTDLKNINVQWPIDVVRYDVDPQRNEWGLAIDCNEYLVPVPLEEPLLSMQFEKVAL